MKKFFLLFLTLISFSVITMSQNRSNIRHIPYDNFNERWEKFHYDSKGDVGVLRRYFCDTVSVEEMKEAFHTYKDKRFKTSPYAAFDSIVYGFHDLSILLNSPLREHPVKNVRNMRGVWGRGNRFRLLQILDKNDTPQDDLLKKVNKDTAIFMSRTYVFLRAPRHYMGFIVSPLPFADTFDKQYRIGTSGFNYRPLDFFSSAVPNHIMDGEWYHRVKAGARYMGQLLNLYYVPDYDMPERTFSILLYEEPRPLHTSVAEYTVELLLPENPDLEIQKAFQWMKSFVEKLRYNTFNPLYTSDMRLMNGRYFRVTVNKCGWLVEDYLDICN